MKGVAALLSRTPLKTIRISYSSDYKSFIIHHVASDSSHPLHILQRRRQAEWQKQGLRWHATTGVDLSKSSCVRSWARRRLRNAVVDELKLRGYNEKGIMVDSTAVHGQSDLVNILQQGRSLDLTGSLRIHVQKPLISAKYTDVRSEVGQLFDIMLRSFKSEPDHRPLPATMGSHVLSKPISPKVPTSHQPRVSVGSKGTFQKNRPSSSLTSQN